MRKNYFEIMEDFGAKVLGEQIAFYRNSLRNKYVGRLLVLLYRIYIELRVLFKKKKYISQLNAIRKSKNGGAIIEYNNSKYQVLHNGNLVKCGKGAQDFNKNILKILNGFMEPEEEIFFCDILKKLPEDIVMIELGSNWAAFSMWAKREKPASKIILVEPIEDLLLVGKHNFEVNKLMDDNVKFINAYIGNEEITIDGVKVKKDINITIEDLFKDFELGKIDILHSDIQGYEYDMLMGSRNLLEKGLINVLFVSTHGYHIHEECYKIVSSYNYTCLCNIPRDQATSTDGLLIFINSDYKN